jgi:hypothetical protein
VQTPIKAVSVGLMSLAMISAISVDSADAQSRRRVGGAIVGGLIVGGIIAGAAAASANDRVYVRESSGCGQYKRRAIWNEDNGNAGKAQYWWDRYEDCRGG